MIWTVHGPKAAAAARPASMHRVVVRTHRRRRPTRTRNPTTPIGRFENKYFIKRKGARGLRFILSNEMNVYITVAATSMMNIPTVACRLLAGDTATWQPES